MFFTGQRWCFCFVVNARCCGLPDFRFWRGAAGGRGPQPGKLCRSWCGSHQNFSGGMSSTAGAQHAGAGNARAHTHLQEFLFDDLLFECVTSARVCLVRCIVWPCGPAATACLSDFVICSQISSRSFFVQFFFYGVLAHSFTAFDSQRRHPSPSWLSTLLLSVHCCCLVGFLSNTHSHTLSYWCLSTWSTRHTASQFLPECISHTLHLIFLFSNAPRCLKSCFVWK